MDERERKMMAFLAGTLWRMAVGIEISDNDIQQLDNIASELGYYALDEKEFRY